MVKTKNSTSGGPSEESHSQVRKGQVDWIPSISRGSEFKSWRFRFAMGAGIYMTKEVYPAGKERRFAWQVALLRAATMGGFGEMLQLLELWDCEGIYCEELLERLERHFLPSTEAELKTAMQQFVAFSRGRRSLNQAVNDLKVILLQCQKLGYRPDPLTKQLRFEALLSAGEIPMLRMYEEREARLQGEEGRVPLGTKPTDDAKAYEVFMNALQALAIDQEQKVQVDASTQGTGPFAGGIFDRRGDGKKAHHKPKRTGYRACDTTQEKPCQRCGRRCGAVRGDDKEKCPAIDKECRKCGKKGHFESVCRSMKAPVQQGAKPKYGEDLNRTKSKAAAAMGGSSDSCDEHFH